MKPKERYLNYALLSSANCDQSPNHFKEDIPIDLSTKRPNNSSTKHNFALFKDFDHTPFPSPPHLNEWTAKYCIPNLMAKQYGYSPAIFPYLFLNSGCMPGHEIGRKHEEPLYEQFALPYRLPQDGLIFPFKVDPYAHNLCRHQDRQSDGERAPLSSESSSSSSVSSSPYEHHEYYHSHSHEFQEMNRYYRPVPQPTQEPVISPSTKGSQVVSSKAKLKKSFSFPNLVAVSKVTKQSDKCDSMRRTKSECNLHLIKSYISHNKICAPKKLFANNYYQNKKENSKECKENNTKNINGTPTRFYRNYRKEVIGKQNKAPTKYEL